jgi:hypothetical protein
MGLFDCTSLVLCDDADLNRVLQMTHDSEGDNDALITYHRNQFSKDPAYLEVADSSVLAGLDNIIRACSICSTAIVDDTT